MASAKTWIDDVLPRCGELAASLQATDAPAAVRTRLRLQTASTVAALFAAEGDERVARITTWALRSSGPHPLLPTGESVGRLEAIVAGVVRARARGWDDYALLGRTGAPAFVVPVVLGAAADFAWSEVEAAQLASVEIALRFGLATLLTPHPGDDAACTSVVAGAIAAARVLRLDAVRTTEALALALAQPQVPIVPLVHEGEIHAASEVLVGVLAAELAFDGAKGRDRVTRLRHEGVPQGFLFARNAFGGLGSTWFASTIHPKEHPGTACVQTAIDAGREVRAQALAVRRKPLTAADVAEVEIETTVLGATRVARPSLARAVAAAMLGHPGADAPFDEPSRNQIAGVVARTRVSHAWDLTSELLWAVGVAIDPARLFGDASAFRCLPSPACRRVAIDPARLFGDAGLRDLALAPLRLRRALADLDLEGPSIGQIAAEISKIATTLGRTAPRDPSAPVALPVATRLRVLLRDGTRLAADRSLPRGAPTAPPNEALDVVRKKLVDAAGPRLGKRRAERLFDLLTDPPPKLRVREVLAALQGRR